MDLHPLQFYSGSTSCNISSKSTMDSHGGWLTLTTCRKLSKCPSQSSKTTVCWTWMGGNRSSWLRGNMHSWNLFVGPIFGGLNPPKQGPFQAKQGSFGFQVSEHFCPGHAPTVSLAKKNDSTPNDDVTCPFSHGRERRSPGSVKSFDGWKGSSGGTSGWLKQCQCQCLKKKTSQ